MTNELRKLDERMDSAYKKFMDYIKKREDHNIMNDDKNDLKTIYHEYDKAYQDFWHSYINIYEYDTILKVTDIMHKYAADLFHIHLRY